jgi:hypothetical protein
MAAPLDYNDVVGVSAEEFIARAPCAAPEFAPDPKIWTKSDGEDLVRIERLLDVKEGTFPRDELYLVSRHYCECGRLLTTYDFVFTGLVDGNHSKSLILHTFVGDKFIVQKPRRLRCSSCGRLTARVERY